MTRLSEATMGMSRREALASVFLGSGFALTGLVLGEQSGERKHSSRLPSESFNAVAKAILPRSIDDPSAVAATYHTSLPEARTEEITQALADLERYSQHRYNQSLSSLSHDQIDALLFTLGVHRVQPVADGTVAERVRYHLVNGLLVTLYRQPVGSTLLGIENPRGHPGGYGTVLGDPDDW